MSSPRSRLASFIPPYRRLIHSSRFFRLISTERRDGRPLAIVDGVSSVNSGFVDQIQNISRGHSSRHLVLSLVVGMFALVVSAIGPGARALDFCHNVKILGELTYEH
jgi:hypothetical protein